MLTVRLHEDTNKGLNTEQVNTNKDRTGKETTGNCAT